MQLFVGPGYGEQHRDLREEGVQLLPVEVICGFKGHFIDAGLHILILRIKRFDAAVMVSFAAGNWGPFVLLLFFQRDGNVRWRHPGLLVKNVYAQRAGRGAKGGRGKGQGGQHQQRGSFFHCVFLWGCRSQENVSICGAGKYSTFREDSRRRK